MHNLGGYVRSIDVSRLGLVACARYRLSLTYCNRALNVQGIILDYLVDACNPDFSLEALPTDPVPDLGPGWKMSRMGVRPLSHTTSTIDSKDGLVGISLGFDTEQTEVLKFGFRLESAELDASRLANHVRYQCQAGKGITIYVKLPKPGQYMLQILAKQDPDEMSTSSLCNYLIQCRSGCIDPWPYPGSDSSKIGCISPTTVLKLEAHSHPDAIVEASDNGLLTVAMKNPNDLRILIQLELQTKGSAADYSDYVWQSTDDHELKIQCRFPRPGCYCMTVFAKEKGRDRLFKPCWRYLINVDNPCLNALPYPSQHPAWKPEYRLFEPMEGYLLEKQTFQIVVCIPRALEVAMVNNNEVVSSLARDVAKEATWLGNVATTSGGFPLTLAARLRDDSDLSLLLEYQVSAVR